MFSGNENCIAITVFFKSFIPPAQQVQEIHVHNKTIARLPMS